MRLVVTRFMLEGHYGDLTSVVGGDDDDAQASLFVSSTSKYDKSVLPLWLGLKDIIYTEENNNPDQANAEQGASGTRFFCRLPLPG